MAKYMVFGYGGIGAALVEQLIQRGDEVIMVSRKRNIQLPNVECITFHDLDNVLTEIVPDYIINTIGVLHDSDHLPEKNINQFTETWLQQSIDINVMPTALIAQSLSRVMSRSSTLKMLAISARVSSITDNHLGGWYSYRMSKAALNMLIKTLAIEWSRQYPHAAIFAYHPGTVDTPLSKPYQANVAPEKLFSPSQAANYLLDVLAKLTIEDSGNLFDWQAKQVPF